MDGRTDWQTEVICRNLEMNLFFVLHNTLIVSFVCFDFWHHLNMNLFAAQEERVRQGRLLG